MDTILVMIMLVMIMARVTTTDFGLAIADRTFQRERLPRLVFPREGLRSWGWPFNSRSVEAVNLAEILGIGVKNIGNI